MFVRHGIAAVVLLVLSSQLALATGDAPVECIIINLSGDVRVKQSPGHGPSVEWKEATIGMTLSAGDQIKTSYDGGATIECGDGTRTFVMPGSLFRVSAPVRYYEYDRRQWKQLTDDPGMLLATDEFGQVRGRLYVRVDVPIG